MHFKDARKTYMQAVEVTGDNVKPLNALCRLLLTEVLVPYVYVCNRPGQRRLSRPV